MLAERPGCKPFLFDFVQPDMRVYSKHESQHFLGVGAHDQQLFLEHFSRGGGGGLASAQGARKGTGFRAWMIHWMGFQGLLSLLSLLGILPHVL